MNYYAIKSPVQKGYRVSVVSALPDAMHKRAEIRRISEADRRQGAAYLLALFERPPARVPFPNQVNLKARHDNG